jgi:ribosomal protein L23
MGKYSGRRPNWKKAIVTLLDGESIEALDLVGQFPEDESEGEE